MTSYSLKSYLQILLLYKENETNKLAGKRFLK